MNIVLASRRKYMRKRTNPEGAPASVEDCIVSLVRDSFPYTGQPITPQVNIVTQDGVPLVVNVDYFVSYSDNVNVGAGVVIVTGTGEYVGSVTKTFQITSAAPSTGWDFDLQKIRVRGSQVINNYYNGSGTYCSHGSSRNDNRLFLHYSNYGEHVVELEVGNGFSLPIVETKVHNGTYGVNEFYHSSHFSQDGKTALVSGNYIGNIRLATFHSDYGFDFDFIMNFLNNTSTINLVGGGPGGKFYDPDSYVEFVNGSDKIVGMSRFGYSIYNTSFSPNISILSVSSIDNLEGAELYDYVDVKNLPGMPTSENTITFRGGVFSPDGTVMVLLFNKAMYKYRLSEPYRVSSGVTLESYFKDSEQVFGTGVNKLTGLLFNENGTRALVFSATTHTAYLIDFNKES